MGRSPEGTAGTWGKEGSDQVLPYRDQLTIAVVLLGTQDERQPDMHVGATSKA